MRPMVLLQVQEEVGTNGGAWEQGGAEEWEDPAPKQAREFLGVPLPKHWEVGTGPETPSLGPLAGNFPSQLA